MKTFTKQQILDKYNKKLTKDKKLEILWDALDYMQQYNGRSKSDCVILAMGFQEIGFGVYQKV